jgi:hypothetical protein
MNTVKSLLIAAAILATPALAHAADKESKRSVAITAALVAVFGGVGTMFVAVYAANAKNKKK